MMIGTRPRARPCRGRAVLLLFLALAGCRQSWTTPGQPDAASGAADAAGGELVAVGSAAALDVATWNIENFPHTVATPELVAEIIATLELDLIAVQEITDAAAFDALVSRLPGYRSVLSAHTYGDGSYQKVGVIYRDDLLVAATHELLFEGEGYPFPRPPLQVQFTVAEATGVELEFVTITVHLKAGLGGTDADRRRLAMELLDVHIRDLDVSSGVGAIVLGDFNEELDSSVGRTVWQPMTASPELYHIHTEILTEAQESSFLPGDRLLDHIVSTGALAEDFAGEEASVLHLERQVPQYEWSVSDHLPVAIRMPIFTSAAAN